MVEEKSNIVKGLSSQSLITITSGVLNVATFAIFSRLLSKDVFGYFAALGAIIAIFQGISEAGLGAAVIQKKDFSKQYFSTAFTLSLFISTILMFLLFVLAEPLAILVSDNTIIWPLRIISLLLIFNSIDSIGRASMIRELNFLRYGMIQITSYILSYGLGIFMAYKGYGLYSLVAAAVLNAIFTCVFIFSKEVKLPQIRIDRKDCRQIISFGGWLTASVIVNQITYQLDKLVMSKWLSVTQLGAYSRPSIFISTISDRFNGIFDTVLFPILSKMQDDKEKIKESFHSAISLLNSFSVALAAIFFFNAELIIQIFFGEDWLDITSVFRILSLWVVLMIDARLLDCFFRSLALVKLNFYLRLICMFIMLGALYVGAQYGIEGVAFSLVFANVLSILIKMTALIKYIDTNGFLVLKEFVVSMKPSVLLILVGSIYLIFFANGTFIANTIFAIIFGIVLFLEFIVYPQMVSYKYLKTIEPYKNRVLRKITNVKRD